MAPASALVRTGMMRIMRCMVQVQSIERAWTYSLETGVAVTGSGRVRTYTVKVEGDGVFIERTEPEE